MTFKHFITRLIIFALITLAWYFGLLLLSIPLTLWYLYQFRALELISIGILIDSYFLEPWSIPYYILGFVFAVLLAELLKPRLRNKSGI